VISRADLGVLAIATLLFVAAPTVGDVGGCGRTASDLDPALFARARKVIDCSRCGECGFASDHCARACDTSKQSDVVFPPTCHPLLHDGEACIRALKAAPCGDYGSYVDDLSPSVPSECDFCHLAADGSAP
jgi:hypothetical protein